MQNAALVLLTLVTVALVVVAMRQPHAGGLTTGFHLPGMPK
jgi:hypothetical protein